MNTIIKVNDRLCSELSDYLISNQRIGSGSFSSIFIGYSKYDHNVKFAIKRMQVDNILKLNKNIKREIELHQKIRHRNIIKIFDVIYDNTIHNNHVFLVLEYCKSGDFFSFQKKRPIKEYFIRKYLYDITEGLKYLYNLKIVHRDLKTKNLLLSDCGDIKIADFGFAKFNNHNNDLKQTYCGSPLYMAPEILYYQKYDNKSDLWSVGIIIYEMITGHPPYHVKNFYQLTKELEKGDVKLPKKFMKIISPQLQKLLYKLLVKDPKKRLGWEPFFKYKFVQNTTLEDENKLLDIDITNFNYNKIKYNKKTESVFYNIDNNNNTNNKNTNNKNTNNKNTNNKNTNNKNTYNNNKKNTDKTTTNNRFINQLQSTSIPQNYKLKDIQNKQNKQNNQNNKNKQNNQNKQNEKEDIQLNFNLLFNSSITKSESELNENELFQSAKSNISDYNSDYDSESNYDESYEIVEKINKDLTSVSAPNKPINIIKKNIIEKNNIISPNKNIFYGSISSSLNILKESYDYLSSHNKSI